MHYYINPIYFYLIDICDTLKNITTGYCILSLIAILTVLLFGSIVFAIDYNSDFEDEDVKNFICNIKKPAKTFIISVIVAFVMMTFIPSKGTCTKMLVTSFVTEENVETATDTIKDTVDYIMDRIEGKEAE